MELVPDVFLGESFCERIVVVTLGHRPAAQEQVLPGVQPTGFLT
jgi:hypothetical protein